MSPARPASIRVYNRRKARSAGILPAALPRHGPLGHRLSILQRIVQALAASQIATLDYAPAIIVMREPDRRIVFGAFGGEGCADFIDRSPSPLKINIRKISVLADAGQPQQFPLRDRHA